MKKEKLLARKHLQDPAGADHVRGSRGFTAGHLILHKIYINQSINTKNSLRDPAGADHVRGSTRFTARNLILQKIPVEQSIK
jgi:hypothetical protein